MRDRRTRGVRGTGRRLPPALLAGAGALLALAPAALAHGIHAPSLPPDTSLWEFGRLGTVHMLGGYDHLLFVFGIAVLFSRLGDVLKSVTLFTFGHSLTLVAATLAGLKVSPVFVDAVIALSVAYVGLEIIGAQDRAVSVLRTRSVIFAFGLVHGLGLSTRLQELGLPQDGVLARVLSFNVGVEVGQLAALAAFLSVVYALRQASLLERLRPRAGSALGVAGLGLCLYFMLLMSVGATP